MLSFVSLLVLKSIYSQLVWNHLGVLQDPIHFYKPSVTIRTSYNSIKGIWILRLAYLEVTSMKKNIIFWCCWLSNTLWSSQRDLSIDSVGWWTSGSLGIVTCSSWVGTSDSFYIMGAVIFCISSSESVSQTFEFPFKSLFNGLDELVFFDGQFKVCNILICLVKQWPMTRSIWLTSKSRMRVSTLFLVENGTKKWKQSTKIQWMSRIYQWKCINLQKTWGRADRVNSNQPQ